MPSTAPCHGAAAVSFEPQTLDELLRATAEQLATCDIARMNLLCATGLPGAEKLDIAKSLHRLDFMARQIGKETERDLPRYLINPKWIYKNAKPETENAFRMSHLACAMQDCFKMHYDARFLRDPKLKAKVDWRTAFADSRAILIHGLLGEKRAGIFTPLSFVGVALGRRLGYPLYLTGTPSYDFVRWDGQGDRFNAEINSGGCHIVREDEVYHKWPEPMRPEEIQSGYFLRNYTPADELALCLYCRAKVLDCNLRFEESLPVWAKCCFLAPKNPEYARKAKIAVGEALFMRKCGRPMEWAGGGRYLRPAETVDEDPRDVLPPKLAATAVAIVAHACEGEGTPGNALMWYRAAVETDPENPDHQRNFDRFRDEFHGQLMEAHVKSQEFIRRHAPEAKLPPLEESIRQFRQSLSAASGRRPDEQFLRRLSENWAGPAELLVPAYESKGMECVREGRWDGAQTAFARAYFHGVTASEKERQLNNLICAIRDEIEMYPDFSPLDDLRPTLHPRMQALIWATRGKVLRSIGRFDEAANAYLKAHKLEPRPEFHTNAMHLREEAERALSNPPGVHSIGLGVPPPFDFQDVGFAVPPELLRGSSNQRLTE
ncbi:MAG TPA: hypothetical protein VIM11_09305 [Tepidisphaeraceae bacterium]